MRAEQAAHHQSEEKIAEMVVELKNAADRYELLEKEHKASSADLNKALNATKEMRTKVRSVREVRMAMDRVQLGLNQIHIQIHEDIVCPSMKKSMGQKLCPCPNPMSIHQVWISIGFS